MIIQYKFAPVYLPILYAYIENHICTIFMAVRFDGMFQI